MADETIIGHKQGVNANGDGTAILRIDEKEWVISRPKFKQYREACLASDKALRVDRELANIDGMVDAVVHAYLDWAPARFAFWRAIVKMLGDKPFPAKDDDLPLWLAGGDPINELMEHWLTSPPEAPGG